MDTGIEYLVNRRVLLQPVKELAWVRRRRMKRGASGIYSIKNEPDKSRKGVRKMIEEGKAAFKANRNMIQMEFVMQSKTCSMVRR